MPDQPEVVAERGFVASLIEKIHQTSPRGFDAAWRAWQAASSPLREAVDRVYAAWLPTVDPAAIPPDADPDLFRIQILNVPGPWEGGDDLVAHLRHVAEVEPPRPDSRTDPARKLWRFGGWHWFADDSPEIAWEGLHKALVLSSVWDLCLPAWTTLTPEIRAMVERHVEEVPASLGTPEAMAWLGRAAARPRTPDYLVLRAIRALSAEEANRLAGWLIDQQLAWRAAGLLPRQGCGPSIDGIVFYFLAKLRGYHGPLDPALEPRARPLELAIFDLFGMYVPDEDVPMWDECPFFEAGVALVPPSDARAKPAVARAGHGERLTAAEFEEPLIVVLDVDLTRPEMAFLGLEGTRLRVCDWADYDPDELCFTRVGLDGEVTLVTRPSRTATMGEPEPLQIPLVPGPEFYSDLYGEDDGPGWTSYNAHIGGPPGWEQEPEVPDSPDSGDPMTFLAQFPHPNSGAAYVFLDPINLVATVVTQWD